MSQSSAMEFVLVSHGALLSMITFFDCDAFLLVATYRFLAIIAENSACSRAMGGWYPVFVIGSDSTPLCAHRQLMLIAEGLDSSGI
jgi:hypothetical protein